MYELTGQDVSRTHSGNTYDKKSKPKVIPTVKQREEVKEKKEMIMPEHAPTQRKVFGYLHTGRYIPNEVIREFVDTKLLYQAECEIKGKLQEKEQIFKKTNAVFVHTDDNGNAVGGEIQGLDIAKRFKGTVGGTGESFFKFVPVKDVKPANDETAIDYWLTYGIADGDEDSDEELEYYTEEEQFKDIIEAFLETMRQSEGLYIDSILGT